MPEKKLLDDPNFCEFYVTAKKSTYAAGGDRKAEVLRNGNGGKRYVFYNEERWPQWRYTDIYHGYNPFFGTETVEDRTISIEPLFLSPWKLIVQMAYSGYAKGTEHDVKRTFAFVEKMLQRVTVQSLFRGPTELTHENGLQYHCQWIRRDQFRVEGRESIMDYYALHQEESYIYSLDFQFCCLR